MTSSGLELYVNSGKLVGTFSSFVPGITAEGILKRIYHALFIQRGEVADLVDIVQKQISISLLTRNIATTHRKHAQDWFKEENALIKQKLESQIFEETGKQPTQEDKSNDAIIQFIHYCLYVMAIMPEPLITYVSLYADSSPWKMSHELESKRIASKPNSERCTTAELITMWKPMPSRKGSQYIVQLTNSGKDWVLRNLVISVVNGKVTVRTNEEHGNTQKRKEKLNSSTKQLNISNSRTPTEFVIEREQKRIDNLVELAKRSNPYLLNECQEDPLKKRKIDNEIQWTGENEAMTRIAMSLESAVVSELMNPCSMLTLGQRLAHILQEVAPVAYEKLHEHFVLSQFESSDHLQDDEKNQLALAIQKGDIEDTDDSFLNNPY